MTSFLDRSIDLNCSRAHAFEVFTRQVDVWWPRQHRRDSKATIIMQTRQYGRLFEHSPGGEEWTIGEIISFEPTSRLEFNWFPGSPTAPTNVAVTFVGDTESTMISIRHQAVTAEAIAVWQDKIALFEKGWDTILPALKTLAETSWQFKGNA